MKVTMQGNLLAISTLGFLLIAAAACTPRVALEAPKEPITINLNITADVRVRIEEAAETDIENNPDIFGGE